MHFIANEIAKKRVGIVISFTATVFKTQNGVEENKLILLFMKIINSILYKPTPPILEKLLLEYIFNLVKEDGVAD